jgi:hypothetical protein
MGQGWAKAPSRAPEPAPAAAIPCPANRWPSLLVRHSRRIVMPILYRNITFVGAQVHVANAVHMPQARGGVGASGRRHAARSRPVHVYGAGISSARNEAGLLLQRHRRSLTVANAVIQNRGSDGVSLVAESPGGSMKNSVIYQGGMDESRIVSRRMEVISSSLSGLLDPSCRSLPMHVLWRVRHLVIISNLVPWSSSRLSGLEGRCGRGQACIADVTIAQFGSSVRRRTWR